MGAYVSCFFIFFFLNEHSVMVKSWFILLSYSSDLAGGSAVPCCFYFQLPVVFLFNPNPHLFLSSFLIDSAESLPLSHLFKLLTHCFSFPFKLVIDDTVAMTPFYLLLGKHRQQGSEDTQSSASAERTDLPRGSAAVREVGGSAD